jgi:hypothetical protein
MARTDYAEASGLLLFRRPEYKSTPGEVINKTTQSGASRVYLVSHVFLKVLLSRYIQTNTSILEPRGPDFIIMAGDSGDNDIRKRQTLFKCEGGGMDNMVGVIPTRRFGIRTYHTRTLCIFL